MALRHHLRPEENPALTRGEAGQRLAELSGPSCDVRVEPEQLELREPGSELGLQLLRPGAEARDLGCTAGRTEGGRGYSAPAVVAVKAVVRVEGERDVAVRAPEGQPARAAVERRRDAAAVEEENRLSASVRKLPELGEEGCGERVSRLTPEIDDLHRRQRASE